MKATSVALISWVIISLAGMPVCTASTYNEEVYQAQMRLKELGYDPGPLDGVWGKATQRAIKKFQKDTGLQVTGRLDKHTKVGLAMGASLTPEAFVQLGHTLGVDSVAFSPDGRYILTGAGKILKLWEVSSGREIRTFIGHTDFVNSVAFSPDGNFALSGSRDGAPRLWDVSTGKELMLFGGNFRKGYSHGVESVVFNKDGRYALSGGDHGYVKLWDVSTGREIRSFKGHKSRVYSVAFSSDDRYALSGSGDNTLKLWEISTGKEIKSLIGHIKGVKSVAFSRDGAFAISGGWDKTVKVWDISTGREIRTFSRHSSVIWSVAISPDDRYALSGSTLGDRSLKLWEISTGKEIWSYNTGIREYMGIRSVAFSPDGRYTIYGSNRGLKLLDISTGKIVKTIRGYSEKVFSVDMSPDLRKGFSVGLDIETKTPRIRVWDIVTGNQIKIFKGLSKVFLSIATSPDGKYAVSIVADEAEKSFYKKAKLKLWDLETGREIREFEGEFSTNTPIALSSNGQYVVSGSIDREDTKLRLWDVGTGKLIRTFEGHKDVVISVAFSPDGRYILSGNGFTRSRDRKRPIYSIKLWDTMTGEEIKSFDGLFGRVKPIVFSSDGRYALSGIGSRIKLWDVSKREEKNRSYMGDKEGRSYGHGGQITSLAFSPDGKYALSGSWDNSIKLWDVSTGSEIRTLEGHTTAVTYVSFSPDCQYAISSSEDNPIRIWDVSTGKELATMVGFGDGGWAVITPEGYFNTSPRGAEHINVRIGNKVYGMDNFAKRFFRPEMVKLALAGKPVPAVEPIYTAAKKAAPSEKIISPMTKEPEKEGVTDFKFSAGQKWAVVIGVSNYQDSRIPSLRYASSDASTFYDWIVSREGGKFAPARIRLLLDQEATFNNIREALFIWLKQAIEEDLVIIYFAGHGSSDSPDSPDNLFLLPYDAQYDSIVTTGFPMWDIETALKRFIKAKKVVVIADACHSGGIGRSFELARRTSRGLKVNPISQAIQNLSQVGDGICVISASDERQMSQESKNWGGGHGVFTYFLLKGLKGEADYNSDYKVTLGELIPYLSEQVRRATRSAQSPTVSGKFDPALTIGR